MTQNPNSPLTKGVATGTGLFYACGEALACAGPGSLVIAFLLTGLMLYCTCHALGELAALFPVPGSFTVYSSRFIDPAWGFAISWKYVANGFIYGSWTDNVLVML